MTLVDERLSVLETWKVEHATEDRIRWGQRDGQDAKDAKQLRALELACGSLDKKVTVLSTKVGLYATIGAVIGGAAFQFLQATLGHG